MFKSKVWVRAKGFDFLSKLHSFFSKTLYFPFLPFPSHLYISLFLLPCSLARQAFFFLGYHLSFLGYFYFFHLAILSGWSLEILDDCQGFLNIWQSIWNRMGNFIRVSAHMQMMPPAHVVAIAQIPGALACRVCATQVVSRRMVIPACLRRSESHRVCWVVNVHWCPSLQGWFHAHVQCCLSQTRRSLAQTTRFLPFIPLLGFSVLCPLLCFCLFWGNRNLGIHASFWYSWNRTKLTSWGQARAQGLLSQLFKPGEGYGEWFFPSIPLRIDLSHMIIIISHNC